MNTNATLTPSQAFDAMVFFLEYFYFQYHSDDLGALLGSMQRFPDGTTYDPAFSHDWQLIMKGKKHITHQEAFVAMKEFLDKCCKAWSLGTVEQLLNNTVLFDNHNINISSWNLWLKAIETSLGSSLNQ